MKEYLKAQSKAHPDVYHPIEHPNSKSDLFLLKNNEFSFITHDSVLKLNDIKTVSINRIPQTAQSRIRCFKESILIWKK